jgi:phosphoribosylformylglycinamidine (FGAM) synthase-like amidotransferase family enzyme
VNKKVFVISNEGMIENLFQKRAGYEIINSPKTADIIVYPGGWDVNPALYGQTAIKSTSFMPAIDKRDQNYWENYKNQGKLLIGICRGGQFLNVMNGGMMWQHVNEHTKSHKMIDLLNDKVIDVTSTHHQMMRAANSGEVIGIAHESNLWMDDHQTVSCQSPIDRPNIVPQFDTEVVWYKDSRSLCFQPHPEYYNATPELKNYFFSLVDRFIQ